MRTIALALISLILVTASCSKRDEQRYLDYLVWQKHRKDSLDSIRKISVDISRDTLITNNPK